jgi:hypothetical protein
MNSRRVGRVLASLLALVMISPVGAQTRADRDAALKRFFAAQNVQVREIALDPCNIKPKIPGMVKQLEAPAKEARTGLDAHADMFERMADQGCANVGKQLPELELYFTAAALLYLDACTYSPDKDYSVELKMARVSYDPRSYAAFMKTILQKPCTADFIAAKLTGKPLAKPAPDAAATPAAMPPPENTRRRRN